MLLSVLLPYFMERRFKMFLKFVLLGISLTLIMFFFDVLLPKIKLKIRLHKELRDKIISLIVLSYQNNVDKKLTIGD